MTERRPMLSRPRTKVYDCNYNIGERHYKSMIDELDRKYGNKPAAPAPPTSLADRYLDDEDTPRMKTRMQSALDEFDGLNGVNGDRRSLSKLEDDFDNEVAASLKRLKSAKSRIAKESSLENEFESTFNSRLNGTKQKLSEKILDSVGINGRMQEALEDDIYFKKRATSVVSNGFDDEPLTRWTALKPSGWKSLDLGESVESARARAKLSKARISDIESEMEQLAERSAAREKRSADLRAFIADSDSVSQTSSSEVKSTRKLASKKVSF